MLNENTFVTDIKEEEVIYTREESAPIILKEVVLYELLIKTLNQLDDLKEHTNKLSGLKAADDNRVNMWRGNISEMKNDVKDHMEYLQNLVK